MKSLYIKFASTTIAIMIFSSVLAFGFSNLYYQHYLKPMNDEKTTKLALEISSYIRENPEINIDDYLNHTAKLGYHITLIDEEFQQKTFQTPFRDASINEADVQAVLNGAIFHGIEQFPHKTFVTGFFANEIKNSIGVPLSYKGQKAAIFIHPNIKLLFNEMHFLIAALLLATILLSIVFVLIFTKYMVRPITKLTKATKEIANGHYKIQLDRHRKDEFGILAKSFMNMAEKLENVEQHRRDFTANISHDIQSPLLNIKGYLSLLETNTMTEAERQYAMQTIQQEINRLSSLTNQLLQLNKIEHQEQTLIKEAFDVSAQILQTIQTYQWQIQQKNIMLSHSLPTTLITADRKLLHMVWDNLLSNAIKYNEEYGMIDIQVIDEAQQVTIIFKDTGIGMDEQAQQRIFERFYRADAIRTRSIEGNGLGLSIVWQIISLHHSHIHVESAVDEGTTITITLAKA